MPRRAHSRRAPRWVNCTQFQQPCPPTLHFAISQSKPHACSRAERASHIRSTTGRYLPARALHLPAQAEIAQAATWQVIGCEATHRNGRRSTVDSRGEHAASSWHCTAILGPSCTTPLGDCSAVRSEHSAACTLQRGISARLGPLQRFLLACEPSTWNTDNSRLPKGKPSRGAFRISLNKYCACSCAAAEERRWPIPALAAPKQPRSPSAAKICKTHFRLAYQRYFRLSSSRFIYNNGLMSLARCVSLARSLCSNHACMFACVCGENRSCSS